MNLEIFSKSEEIEGKKDRIVFVETSFVVC